MTFHAPWRLLLLLVLPALAVLYAVVQKRRQRHALRFTNLPVLAQVSGKNPAWRRHVCAGLFILMLGIMITGFSQPTTAVKVPRDRATIMVAIDVSLSMMATDVEPSRFEAAKNSAKNFIRSLPERFNVGVISFAGVANLVSPPTADRLEAIRSVDSLVLARRTAIGEAVFASLQAIKSFDATAGNDPPPSHIVLLSDGDNTYGRSLSEAVAAARAAHVPVSTIAFGTPYGTVTIEGETTQVEVNKDQLRYLAEATQGKPYEAADAGQLSDVYANIGTSLGFRLEDKDISSRFLGIALMLAFASGALSLFWFSRLP